MMSGDGRLTDDAQLRRLIGGDILGRFDDLVSFQVLDDPADLDVSTPADHEHEVTVVVKSPGRLVDAGHKRTGGVNQLLPGRCQTGTLAVR